MAVSTIRDVFIELKNDELKFFYSFFTVLKFFYSS